MQQNNFIEDFFQLLNKAQIEYCVLRNYKLLPKSTGGSDLDIWVGVDYYDEFFSVIKKCIEMHKGQVVSYIWKRFESKICLLGEDWGVQLDVYKEVIPVQECPFINGNFIRKNLLQHQGVKVLNEEWSDLETFLKETLNTGFCDRKANFFPDAQKALSNITIQELKEVLPILSPPVINLIHSISNKEYSQDLISKVYCLGVKDIKKERNKFYFDKVKKYKRFFKKPGYMIAILGTDGSGKTTVINTISPILEGAFHNGIHYKHLRPHLIPDIGILMKKREKQCNGISSPQPHSKKQSGFLGSFFRWSYYMIDYVIGYVFKIFPIISTKSHLFILDRYYFDYYIDQNRSLTKLPIWILQFGEFFIPQPDLILCLGGNAEVLYKRKPETSLKEVERQVNALKQFSEKRANAVWINSDCGIDETVEASMKAIIEMMSTRFKNIKSI